MFLHGSYAVETAARKGKSSPALRSNVRANKITKVDVCEAFPADHVRAVSAQSSPGETERDAGRVHSYY